MCPEWVFGLWVTILLEYPHSILDDCLVQVLAPLPVQLLGNVDPGSQQVSATPGDLDYVLCPWLVLDPHSLLSFRGMNQQIRHKSLSLSRLSFNQIKYKEYNFAVQSFKSNVAQKDIIMESFYALQEPKVDDPKHPHWDLQQKRMKKGRRELFISSETMCLNCIIQNSSCILEKLLNTKARHVEVTG